MAKVTVTYRQDKECKHSIRFAPEDEKAIGNATLYIGKDMCTKLGIDPAKGFTLELQPK